MKKAGKLGLAAAVLAVLLCASGAVLPVFRADWRYYAAETLRRPAARLPLELADIGADALRGYSLSELSGDSRVVFTENLMLVNRQFTLSADYVPAALTEPDDGLTANPALSDALRELSVQTEERFGQPLYVLSAYRSPEEQAQVAADEGEKAAQADASEHRTGLALDVCVKYFAGSAFLKSPAGRYVQSACWQYGFIVRYPLYGEDETGYSFEPWHLRYVGEPHAEIIYKTKSTLEEYIASLEPGRYYRAGEYLLTRQNAESILLPEFSAAEISPDHTGYYIFTLRP